MAYAREQGKRAVSLREKMIDKPIVDRAAYILETDRLIRERGKIMRKPIQSLEEAIRLSGLQDGMTVSFHHYL
jgi:citrate lyase alpha subunit